MVSYVKFRSVFQHTFTPSTCDVDDSLTNLDWLINFNSKTIGTEVEPSRSSPPPSDVTKKPSYSYPQLISMALKDSYNQKLTLCQIYTWIKENFIYFQQANSSTWQNSIRHCLSTHKAFGKCNFGNNKNNYWCIKRQFAHLLNQERTSPTILQTSTKELKTQLSEYENQKQKLTGEYDTILNNSEMRNSLQEFFETFGERQDEVQDEIQEVPVKEAQIKQEIVEDDFNLSDIDFSDFDLSRMDAPNLNLFDDADGDETDDSTFEAAMDYSFLSEDKDTIITGSDCNWNTSTTSIVKTSRTRDSMKIKCEPSKLHTSSHYVPSDHLSTSQLFDGFNPDTLDIDMF